MKFGNILFNILILNFNNKILKSIALNGQLTTITTTSNYNGIFSMNRLTFEYKKILGKGIGRLQVG